ncbi:hypothetical protein QTP70_017914 [Hemibagrus guttatus]|uniref:Reverse transcriptase domain-containing protein n=1 Tax=Hemibagrus guttatus TaxID=175788 RepID=A0AAE0QZP0_9TELE|nr:hypothetical protein QTP70_017914 [Hemibagrus guttatus]
MWQGIQSITNYRPAPPACDSDASLPDALNSFYARFEAQNDVTARKTIPPPEDQVLCLTTADVRKTLCRVNPRKTAGQTTFLAECSANAPTPATGCSAGPKPGKNGRVASGRASGVKPVPSCCANQLVRCGDPEQGAAESNFFYVRMLFIDFSSAFNMIIPQHLTEKLILLGINTSLCNWILDFLTGRPQSVLIGNSTSSATTLNTGAPQGCVLSPLLFTLLTHDCAAMHSSNYIIKLTRSWRAQSDHSPLNINGSNVEIVKSTKFLGVNLAEDLACLLNTSSITKKAQQRLYFLRKLRKAHLPPLILTTFYRETIESILSSCITA